MKKISSLFIALILTLSVSVKAQTFYDLKAKTIDGKDFNFADLKGKKVLVVNTASKCGNTPQYEDLEKLYKEYKDKNLVIIGFPANNFMHQEPGSNSDIKEFCTKNYGVSFQMMEKISVKGDDMDPIYHWLTEKAKNGSMDSSVKWNFQKYMINEKGELVGMVDPGEKPYSSEKLMSWLNGK